MGQVRFYTARWVPRAALTAQYWSPSISANGVGPRGKAVLEVCIHLQPLTTLPSLTWDPFPPAH